MLRKLFSLSCLFCSFFVCLLSCSKEEVSVLFDSLTGEQVIPKEFSCRENFVSAEMVKEFVLRNNPQVKGCSNLDVKIEPYGLNSRDPLLYLVNYGVGDGWQIISSDTRVPAILAEGETGYFSIEEGSPAVRTWIDYTASILNVIRNASDEELSFSQEVIRMNQSVWKVDTCKNNTGYSMKRKIPAQPNDGSWEVYTTVESIINEEIDHLTPHWDQDSPYNDYCPYRTDFIFDRAPAGCVAVAASEVLCYLNKKWNVPETMISAGSCVGDISGYEQSFWGESSSIWSDMSFDYRANNADAESLLIGYVGKELGIKYGNTGSLGYTSDIQDLLNSFGISSSFGDYNESSVTHDLLRAVPVIVRADSGLSSPGHCFVIDGFRSMKYKYKHEHYWVPDHGSGSSNYHPAPYYTYSYSNPEISAIKVNWGWSSQWSENPVNDGWYLLSGGWFVYNGGMKEYNHGIRMIYNINPQ